MEPTSSSSPPSPNTNTVEAVFQDFRCRRAALIRALTHDIDQLYESCAPGGKELCLFGYRDESWAVSFPFEEVPPVIPEPVVGINFARDGMPRKEWIAMVAVHSDAWLISVASYLGARLSRTDRKILFTLINSAPNVYESVKDWKGPANDNPRKDYSSEASGSKSSSSEKGPSDGRVKSAEEMEEETRVQNEEDDVETPCGQCDKASGDDFWIACDVCQLWFHGMCVGVTPTMAQTIGQYKCPFCQMEQNKPTKPLFTKADRT